MKAWWLPSGQQIFLFAVLTAGKSAGNENPLPEGTSFADFLRPPLPPAGLWRLGYGAERKENGRREE